MNQLTRTLSFLAISLLMANALHAAELPPLKKDIEFAKIGDVSLKLDAFVPEGEGPFPTCILVHGGGFTKGTKQSYITPIFEPLSKSGFVWFTID
jgi:acetyl esterase